MDNLNTGGRHAVRLAYEGSCPCGNLRVVYHSAITPADWSLRACQCEFCQSHQALATSDPAGLLHFTFRDGAKIARHQFGHRTAEFYVCVTCGTYGGAACMTEQGLKAVVVVRLIPGVTIDPSIVTKVNFADERVETRLKRRLSNWTPTVDIINS